MSDESKDESIDSPAAPETAVADQTAGRPAASLVDTEADANGWEWWTRLSLVLAAVMLIAWVAVFARIGITSVKVHAMVIPSIGALTLPFLAWGLLRTLFRPPALRRSRTVAFFVLLFVGYIGNVPFFAVPLETEDWSTDLTFHLPFDGEWTTLAGGDDLDTNYHATTAALRWGYDFTPLREGKKFQLDGAKPSHFHCWGQPVYAPVGGKIAQAKNDVIDNDPGELASDSVFGNHVVIKAHDGVFVFVAHMQKDSLTVRAGDEVEPLQKIGACGNSGRTVEPHVHVHAQDRLEFPIAMGLPLRFSDYSVSGKTVDSGMPSGASEWSAVDGDLVTPNTPR